MKEIISKELSRVLTALGTKDVLDPEYEHLLNLAHNVSGLYWSFFSEDAEDAQVAPVEPGEHLVSEAELETAVQFVTDAAADESVSVSIETPELTRTYVRGLLADASKNGVVVKPILSKYVPEGKPVKFSEVPESAYEELVKEVLENAK